MLSVAALLISAPTAFVALGSIRGASAPLQQRAAVRAVAEAGLGDMMVAEKAKASFDTTIDTVPKCPLTRWNSDGIDLSNIKAPARTLPVEVIAETGMSEEDWIAANRDSLLSKLTMRESQVLERIVAGRLNKQIADDLGISIKTVEAHRANIMEKLSANTVADLLKIALGQSNPKA